MRLDALAEREQAVLRGILSGLSNRKIADRIGASEASVKGTLQQLFNVIKAVTPLSSLALMEA